MAWSFLVGILVLTAGAMGWPPCAYRSRCCRLTTRTNSCWCLTSIEARLWNDRTQGVREIEAYLAKVPEVADYTSYVGLASPMDFNGLVLITISGKAITWRTYGSIWRAKSTAACRAAIGLRMRNDLQEIADRHQARMKLVETPPGPPVIASIVAEVYGQPDMRYEDLLLAADTVRARLAVEPGVVDSTTDARGSKKSCPSSRIRRKPRSADFG